MEVRAAGGQTTRTLSPKLFPNDPTSRDVDKSDYKWLTSGKGVAVSFLCQRKGGGGRTVGHYGLW